MSTTGFGKSFYTLKEARAYLKKIDPQGRHSGPDSLGSLAVRRMSKRHFPRRKKLHHVGSYLDFLNFA